MNNQKLTIVQDMGKKSQDTKLKENWDNLMYLAVSNKPNQVRRYLKRSNRYIKSIKDQPAKTKNIQGQRKKTSRTGTTIYATA